MQYLLGFYEGAAEFAARDRDDEAFWSAWHAYFAAIDGAGIRVAGVPLVAPERARSTRVRDGAAIVHDGPFAEAKEQLGGFVVIDVPSLDEALAWAERCPATLRGAVEVRPVLPMENPGPPPEAVNRPRAGSFMLSLFESPAELAQRNGPEAQRYWSQWEAYAAEMGAAGVLADGAALREPQTATVVRSVDGRATVHDGPYAETREQLGGYLILDVPTMDDALAWAARCPAAFTGAVEVREVMPMGARV